MELLLAAQTISAIPRHFSRKRKVLH